jgi:CRP-like cAMP-binding protein
MAVSAKNAKDDPVGAALWAAELSDEEIERARRGTTVKHYAKGAYICHTGDQFDYWTGIVEGLVKMSAISHDGKAVTFAGLGVGSWFGEGTVLKGEARKYDLVALRDVRLALMARPTFMWLYENSAGFTRFLVRQLNERLGQFIAMTEYERILDPKARVARSLSWFFNPVLYPGAGRSIEISQEELGLLVGVSRPVVNRSLQSLEEEGLIRSEHGRVTVLDLNALQRYGA